MFFIIQLFLNDPRQVFIIFTSIYWCSLNVCLEKQTKDTMLFECKPCKDRSFVFLLTSASQAHIGLVRSTPFVLKNVLNE